MTMGQSAASPLVEAYLADAPAPRRIVLLIVVRTSAVVLGTLLLYALMPVREETATAVAGLAVLGLVAVAAIFGRQLARIGRSKRPVLAAIEALALVVTLFVALFASLYVSTSAADPESFTQPVDKVAGIYFTVTILGTVGFGDIAAVSQPARIAVTVQMVLDLILIGVAVKLLGTSARRAVEAKLATSSGQADPDAAASRALAEDLVDDVASDRHHPGSQAQQDGASGRRLDEEG